MKLPAARVLLLLRACVFNKLRRINKSESSMTSVLPLKTRFLSQFPYWGCSAMSVRFRTFGSSGDFELALEALDQTSKPQ
jgi:hypothetical protein